METTQAFTVDWTTWQPTDRAVLCFVFRKDEVLLIEKLRGLGKGKVNGPGGRIEPDETPEQAAVRECQEEVGVTPRELSYVGDLRFAFVNGYNLSCAVFRAESFEGEPHATDEAIPFWCDVRAIPFERMWSDDREWFPHLLATRKFDGRFVFDDDRMLDMHLVPAISN